MDKPILHVQNVFDALNPLGKGVTGRLKLKCLHLQTRVVGLANSGDFIVASADCSPAFIEYMLGVTGVEKVLPLSYRVSDDPRQYLDARSVFKDLVHNSRWEAVRQSEPVLSPYMQSAAIFEAARTSGLQLSEREWKATVTDRMTERMNDKGIFYKECEELGLAVPRHWVVGREELLAAVIELLKMGHNPLYIRQTRSGGGVGNLAVEKDNLRYLTTGFPVTGLGTRLLSHHEFMEVLKHFVNTSFWGEFLIAELLDLQASPGTLFYADDVTVSVISHTYQILSSNRLFLGFMYPIEEELIRRHFGTVEEAVRILIEPWRQVGYRGYGNIDWMITKSGEVYLAERNARQTSVVAPLKIANKVSRARTSGPTIVAPSLAILTEDIVDLERPMTFEGVYGELQRRKLLFQHGGHSDGVIITIPPSPRFGIKNVGIMAVGANVSSAYETYCRTLDALGAKENELLLDLEV